MTAEEFKASDKARWSGALLALWHDGHGDWERAHQVAQDVDGPDGAWVHAYLHRREGDIANARYWYRQAGRQEARGELAGEWEAMVGSLLSA